MPIGNSLHTSSSRDLAHGSHRRAGCYPLTDGTPLSIPACSVPPSPFMMPSYQMTMGKPSCAAAAGAAYRQVADCGARVGVPYAQDSLYKTYGASSSRRSPSRSSVGQMSSSTLPHPRNPGAGGIGASSVHYPSIPAGTSSGNPMDLVFPQYQDPPPPPPPKQSGPPEPPKKPLSPYMRFSKSVSCFVLTAFSLLAVQAIPPIDISP